MSGSTKRLIPANTTLLQPGSQYYRISDALNAQRSATNTVGSSTGAQITTLQNDVTTLQGQVTTLQGQVSTLQGQVTTLQGQVAAQQLVINSFSYLQTEVSTGTLFLDQRTIYKRSFVINNALNTSLNVFSYPHAIANINYVVNIQAMAAQAQGQQLPLTFVNMAQAPSLGVGLSIWADATSIYVAVGTQAFAGYQVLATLWYTATDR